MTKKRIGNQEPCKSICLPYKKSLYKDVQSAYEQSGHKVFKWQVNLLKSLMAINKDGLYTHTRFGYAIPRRNGKYVIISNLRRVPMIEKLIPKFQWDGKYWAVVRLPNHADAEKRFKYMESHIKNILVEVKAADNYVKITKNLFQNFSRMENLILKEGNELRGVFKRSK